MTKNLLSQPFGCVGRGSSQISIPMAWISFGNDVHFPESYTFFFFFTCSLNISQTYFGKIVLRMIKTVSCCQQCELAFKRSKWVRKHFDSISHVQAFKIPKDFGLWQLFHAAHRPHRRRGVSSTYDTVHPVAFSWDQSFSKSEQMAIRVLFS